MRVTSSGQMPSAFVLSPWIERRRRGVTQLFVRGLRECCDHAGSLPKFADIDARTFNVDPNEMVRATTKQTKALLLLPVWLSLQHDRNCRFC